MTAGTQSVQQLKALLKIKQEKNVTLGSVDQV